MFKKSIIAIFIGLFISNCDHIPAKEATEQQISKELIKVPSAEIDYSGNYVTEEYQKRNNGYDWLVLSSFKKTDTTIHIKVRSRNDRKKATCTFEGVGVKIGTGVFKVANENFTVLVHFKDSQARISGVGIENDESVLHWFCSGGASLSDYTFYKLNETLDSTQLKN